MSEAPFRGSFILPQKLLGFTDIYPNTQGTPNATRPDIVRETKNGLEAIEVKNYNLDNPNNRSTLYSEVKRQVTERVEKMPEGTLQRIVLDTKGRDFSKGTINLVITKLQESCSNVYPNLPITVMR